MAPVSSAGHVGSSDDGPTPSRGPQPLVDEFDLLRAYEPIVRLTEGELFFPTAVEEYIACCELVERVDGQKSRVVLAEGDVTLELLAEIGAANPDAGLFLRFVDRPLSTIQIFRWRHRQDRPRFKEASRLARVGVLSRLIDALVRVSLFFRGGVASGTQARAEVLYRTRMRRNHHPYYARVVRDSGYVALQYWYFYVFNDWRSRVYGVNDHEADWEQVTVYLAEQPAGPPRPAWVAFSAHDEIGDDLRRRWDDPDLTLVGDHPVVFAGLGSHSGAYLSGDYLTTIDPPAFKRLVRTYRAVTRALLPWAREQTGAGVGIPYIDYARGDGVTIGPDQDRAWTPVVIDDETPWVFDYQGLWGNDTADPLGGERGPAGPRYERAGTVRQSWGDSIGWSGLAKVAPNAEAAAELVRQRLDDLRVDADVVQTDLDAHRTTLRADVASGVTVDRAQVGDLDELAAREVALGDERRRLERRLTTPSPLPGPHEHLRHRRMPVPPEPRARRRVLAIWSAVSTPLILAAIGLAFLPDRSTSVTTLILFWLFVLLVIEAVARRRLVQFLVTIVVIAVFVGLITTIAGLTVYFGWQITVSICFGAMALLLLIANLTELVRD